MIAVMVQGLREQLIRAKGLKTLGELAEEIGVTRPTMARFLRGGYTSLSTVEAVEQWLSRKIDHRYER